MFTVTKTICVKVFEPTKVKEQILADMLKASCELSRFYVDEMERLGTYSKKILHKETYLSVKTMYPKLPTGLIQTIRDKAIEAYKSYLARKKKGKKATLPQFKNPVIRFDCRTFTLYKPSNSFEYFVSLSTPERRLALPIVFGRFHLQILNRLYYESYKFCTAELRYDQKHKCYMLNITYQYHVDEIITTAVCGIDLGLKNTAVLAVPGQEVCFFPGSRHNQKRRHYAALRRVLGQKKLMKEIKNLGSKEQRYMKDVNHKISSEIVSIAEKHKAIIQMENLTDIRDRIRFTKKMNKELHNWNFRQLQTFIEYKANAAGIPVVYIDPRNTSRKCHVCGCTEKKNRPRQNYFHCTECGYSANADYNAAVNIAAIA